ncbi:uncharacterized protein V6R79_024406 [Siganus canaliculatus]
MMQKDKLVNKHPTTTEGLHPEPDNEDQGPDLLRQAQQRRTEPFSAAVVKANVGWSLPQKSHMLLLRRLLLVLQLPEYSIQRAAAKRSSSLRFTVPWARFWIWMVSGEPEMSRGEGGRPAVFE